MITSPNESETERVVMRKPVILCIGSDARYIYTCEELCSLGKVYSYGTNGSVAETAALDCIGQLKQKVDLLVLPVLSGKGLDITLSEGEVVSCCELSPLLAKNAVVTGGRLNTQIIEYFSSLGHDVEDYFDREELVIRNCIPTAEGALQIAISEIAVTVNGTNTLIIGYGRVAKACARLFSAVGSKVSVAARKLSQLAMAQNEGCESLPLGELSVAAQNADIVINTVPALVLTRSELEMMKKDALIIDLASKPGGTDFEAAQRLGRRVVHALALPGRTAPITSGKIIAEAVRNIFIERRETDVFTRH